MKKLVFLFTALLCLSGCQISNRENYISCAAGSGRGEDYHLEYDVYLDFGIPSLEVTKINTLFKKEEKEKAYVFSKRYKILTSEIGSISIVEKEEGIIVRLTKYEKAKFKTLQEYTEKVNTLNKKGKVCTVLQR